MTIEDLWASLAVERDQSAQKRISGHHPHDIYADHQPPNRIGLVVVSSTKPPQVDALRAISVEERQRSDGRWVLRLTLENDQLRPVFSALCNDVIECTKANVHEAALSRVVVGRIARWRSLLERGGGGLDDARLRGLIAELTVLSDRILQCLPPVEALRAWTGPQGTPQDFQLPDGARLEVKAVTRSAVKVHINGLTQLDAGGDPLTMVVVRLEPTGASAPNAVSAASIVEKIRRMLDGHPVASSMFEQRLADVGWFEHPDHFSPVVRITAIEDHAVDARFPRLTRSDVMAGIVEADYFIMIPN